MKKKKFLATLSSIALLFATFIVVNPSAMAESGNSSGNDPALTVEASTNPVSGVDISVTYNLNGEIVSSSGTPGADTEWSLELSDSSVTVSGSADISLMGVTVLDESFNETQDIPLGTEVKVPVAAGGAVKVPVKITASVQNIEVTSGKAESKVASLEFNSSGTKEFTVSISENAQAGETIKVSEVEVHPEIRVGLEASVDYGLGTWEKDIASRDIEAPAMEPTLQGTATVQGEEGGGGGEGGGTSISPLLIGGIVIVVLVLIGVAYVVQKFLPSPSNGAVI